ncbi:putative GTPase [bioreactor metagenome]|uniref:Putative GTPase n=1 Tax=bioreactor metagenome TaxID=1076179 RepID=A0A645GHQ8_9ZZZZ
MTGEGIADIWSVVEQFKNKTQESGIFTARRRKQTLSWVYSMVEEHLRSMFFQNAAVVACKNTIEHQVVEGEISATMAVQELIRAFEKCGN